MRNTAVMSAHQILFGQFVKALGEAFTQCPTVGENDGRAMSKNLI